MGVGVASAMCMTKGPSLKPALRAEEEQNSSHRNPLWLLALLSSNKRKRTGLGWRRGLSVRMCQDQGSIPNPRKPKSPLALIKWSEWK